MSAGVIVNTSAPSERAAVAANWRVITPSAVAVSWRVASAAALPTRPPLADPPPRARAPPAELTSDVDDCPNAR